MSKNDKTEYLRELAGDALVKGGTLDHAINAIERELEAKDVEIARLRERWAKSECEGWELSGNQYTKRGGEDCELCSRSRSGADFCPAVREVVEG